MPLPVITKVHHLNTLVVCILDTVARTALFALPQRQHEIGVVDHRFVSDVHFLTGIFSRVDDLYFSGSGQQFVILRLLPVRPPRFLPIKRQRRDQAQNR